MRLIPKLSLLACLCVAACADHSGSLIVARNNPQAPINGPDTGTQPTEGAGSGGSGGSGGTTNTVVETGGGSGTSGGETGGGGGSGGSGGGGGTEGGGSGGGTTGGGTGGEGNPEGSQPVPEPSTLLLLGTGLAGAALLRRRKQKVQPS